MDNFLMKLLETSLVMSILAILFILANLILGNKYKSKWKYNIWLAFILCLIIPVKPEFNLPFGISVNEEVKTSSELGIPNNTTQNNLSISSSNKLKTTNSYDSKTISTSQILFLIWLIGAILLGCYYIFKNTRTKSILHRWSINHVPENIMHLFQNTKASLDIQNDNIKIKICKLNITPMIIGIKNPIILIPNKKIPDDELAMILKHELIHYKRHDLIKKFLGLISLVLHWFNPIVHLINYKMKIECETSCDEEVLHGLEMNERILYGEAIIGIIQTKPSISPIVSTKFYGGKNGMKKRISAIVNNNKRNKLIIPIILGCIVISIGMLSNSVIANSKEITYDEAKEIVLNKTNGGTVISCNLNTSKEDRVYDMKVVKGNEEFCISVGTKNSKIYSCEVKNTNASQKEPTSVVPSQEEFKENTSKSNTSSSNNLNTSTSNSKSTSTNNTNNKSNTNNSTINSNKSASPNTSNGHHNNDGHGHNYNNGANSKHNNSNHHQ